MLTSQGQSTMAGYAPTLQAGETFQAVEMFGHQTRSNFGFPAELAAWRRSSAASRNALGMHAGPHLCPKVGSVEHVQRPSCWMAKSQLIGTHILENVGRLSFFKPSLTLN